MTPFAIVAYLSQNKLSYGLLSELPKNDSSVVGAAAVESHFPSGIVGPVTLLVDNPDADFRTDADSDDKRPGWEHIRALVDTLAHLVFADAPLCRRGLFLAEQSELRPAVGIAEERFQRRGRCRRRNTFSGRHRGTGHDPDR